VRAVEPLKYAIRYNFKLKNPSRLIL
jgi:hypothetical protein